MPNLKPDIAFDTPPEYAKEVFAFSVIPSVRASQVWLRVVVVLTFDYTLCRFPLRTMRRGFRLNGRK